MTMGDDPGLAHLRTALALDDAARDHPGDELIDDLRARFPTEAEFDRLLTRKQRRRREPRRPGVDLPGFVRCTEAFLADHLDGPFTVSDARWLAGGGSKIQLAFTLEWDEPGAGRARTELAARMEPQESLSATSRRREAELLRAFAGTIPVPRVHWLDEDGSWFPEPALIYALAPGVPKPSAVAGRPGGVGSDFGPRLRPILGRQFVDHLAAIHTFDPAGHDLGSFDRPALGGPDAALWQLNRARRLWEEDRRGDLPLLEVAANWLERHPPPLDHLSVVHGDYRTGNFLFDEPTGEFTAILDWERGHLGDRHRDLAWTLLTQFGHLDDDGTTFLVSGLLPREDFLSRYQEVSGLTVDPDTLRYYGILNAYQLIASTLGTAYRVVRLGRSHQDVLLAWIEGLVYPVAETLRSELAEAGS